MEANYWSFGSHRPPQIMKVVQIRTPIQEQFMRNQCRGEYWYLLGEILGSSRVQKDTRYPVVCTFGCLFCRVVFYSFSGEPSNTGEQCPWRCGSLDNDQPQGNDRPRTGPQDPGTPATDRQEAQTGVKDNKGTE